MTSRPVRICFYQKWDRSWSQFRINFSQYSMRFFQSALVEFNKLWMHFIFIYFNSKIPSLTLQMESWAQCLGGFIFSCSRGNCMFFFQFPLWYFWNSINLAYVSQLGDEDLVSDYIFISQRESHSVPDMGFLLTFNYFVPFGVIENRFTKINFKYFNGNCDYSSCPGWWILFLYEPPHKGLVLGKNYLGASLSFLYSLKITCILLEQIISLKNMVVLPVKFTIWISCSPLCIPLIFLSALMKLTSVTVLYNSMDSRHPWRMNIRIKGSDSRPFILILD